MLLRFLVIQEIYSFTLVLYFFFCNSSGRLTSTIKRGVEKRIFQVRVNEITLLLLVNFNRMKSSVTCCETQCTSIITTPSMQRNLTIINVWSLYITILCIYLYCLTTRLIYSNYLFPQYRLM